MKKQGYVQREREHFDKLALTKGNTSFDRDKPAGQLRLRCRAKLLAAMVKDSNLAEPLKLLELGAGTGAFTEHVLAEFPNQKLVAVDISPECVRIASETLSRQYPQAVFETGDCADLPYPAESFDVVFGCSILHHLPLETTLQSTYSLLKPGGAIWFSEPNMLNPQIALQKNVGFVGKMIGDTEDETAFFKGQLSRILRIIGYESVSVQPFDFLHPSTPKPLIPLMEQVTRLLENIPVLREIAGSLAIKARKPG